MARTKPARERDTSRIADNFEQFNPYAAEAAQSQDEDITTGLLAVAFELAQLRFIINTRFGGAAHGR